MHITKFVIRNYRSIKNIEVKMGYAINPIIGVNESGKTSILNAILAFNKKRDSKSKQHLEYKNRYILEGQECCISAYVQLTTVEMSNLIKDAKIKTDSDDYSVLNDINPLTHLFVLTRWLSDRSYTCEVEGLSAAGQKKVTNTLVNIIPYVLYFDDFTDRVPESVVFASDFAQSKKFLVKNKDWQETIIEIFKRSRPSLPNAFQHFLSTEGRTRRDMLRDIQQVLNNEIIKPWHELRNAGNSLVDEPNDLFLEMEEESPGKFTFFVCDKSSDGGGDEKRDRTFLVSERSKGFQWFFNFMIQLKFNSNYTAEKLENSLFLLDEPGSYLHSSAQRGLLKTLENVALDNPIIYCTHSQYLLDPSIVKLGSIKIAGKKDGIIDLVNFGDYSKTKDKGALTPIYNALQLNFNHDFTGKLVLLEGTSDYFFFKMLQEHSTLVDNEITFIPGTGASSLETLISFAIAHASDFVVFLDNDKAGKVALKKYTKSFGQRVADRFHLYGVSHTSWELENFLCPIDTKKLLDLSKVEDKKNAISILFYDYKGLQKNFINSLSGETKANLDGTLCILKELRDS